MRKGARATHTRDTTGVTASSEEFGEERREFLQITHVRGPLPTYSLYCSQVSTIKFGEETRFGLDQIYLTVSLSRQTHTHTDPPHTLSHAYFSSADSSVHLPHLTRWGGACRASQVL